MTMTAGLTDRTVAACRFAGLGDPTRLAILQLLAEGEYRVADLTGRLGLAQSTVSGHLACLRDCGLVESRPVGRASVYRLSHAEEVLAVFAAAEQLLALTGESVALCPTFGTAQSEGVA